MDNFRENYFVAREIVARELKEKYNLVESYKDDNRLTLDGTKYSIHLTFYIPDGNNVFISEKGKEPLSKDSYFGHISGINYTMNEIDQVLKINASKFDSLPKETHEFDTLNILRYFHICLAFFETEYPNYFNC